jgi:hypothetical protein
LPSQPNSQLEDFREPLHPQIGSYLHLFEITDADKEAAHLLWTILDPQIEGIVSRFYAKIRQSEIGFHISDGIVERLKKKQREHWTKLFSSRFDEDYSRSVHRIGIRHRDIELGSSWYVTGYMVFKMDIVNAILHADISMVQKGRLLRAAEKFIALDMMIALSAYDNAGGIVD